MAHISSIGAALFTDLAVAYTATSSGVATAAMPATYDNSGFAALFVTSTGNCKYFRIQNVREFPAVGTPANIVNVPVFGQKQSQTIQGQADAPSLEVTINFVPSEWAKGTTSTTWSSGVISVSGNELGNMVGDGIKRAWRLALLGAAPSATLGASQSHYDSNSGGLGTASGGNSVYYWTGKLEALLVTPSLTDAMTAKLTFSIQSDFYGAYTQ